MVIHAAKNPVGFCTGLITNRPRRCVSIVRDDQPRPDQFDVAVPRYSQNMNNVFALHGVSEVVAVTGEHFIGGLIRYALAWLLAQ